MYTVWTRGGLNRPAPKFKTLLVTPFTTAHKWPFNESWVSMFVPACKICLNGTFQERLDKFNSFLQQISANKKNLLFKQRRIFNTAHPT